MKVVLLLFALINLYSGFKIEVTTDNDIRDFLQSLNHDCPVAPSEGLVPELSYWLYTRQNREGVQLFEDKLHEAGWARTSQLKILIHGYWNDRHSEMNTALSQAYLDYGEYNIIIVDWGHYVKKACYPQGVSSINPVAGSVGEFIRKVMEVKSFNPVHILGHSLGAHVSARVSSVLARGHAEDNPPVDRLTRFDPAMPLFLDCVTNPGKAKFKDVYHSNIGILGQTPAEGDVDVYLNNGQFQPGCDCNLGCSHMRSVLYFAESISRGMKGFYCSSWEHFVTHKCKQPTAEDLKNLGDNIDTSLRASFTVFGREKSPFLFDAEDYLDPEKFEKFKDLGKPSCDVGDIVQMVKDFLS